MSAGAASQFHFDTVLQVTSAAQVEQAESSTNLSLYLKRQDNPDKITFCHLYIYWTAKKYYFDCVSNGLKTTLKFICAPP